MAGIAAHKTIAFGTDGIRGNAENFPFTQDAVFALGQSIAAWAKERYCKEHPKILVGYDTRISGPRIKKNLCLALASQGVTVLDGGVLPTPAVCQRIFCDSSFDAGVVISASHNPWLDNGIKIFDAQRCKIAVSDEEVILKHFEHFFQQPFSQDNIAQKDVFLMSNAAELYCQHILRLFPETFLRGISVVLDCANGATSTVAPAIFKALGADVYAIAATPDGLNINDECGALHPEKLAQMVVKHKAHCGFGFDGDGDRIVVVNRHGHIKDGDDVMALLLKLSAYAQVPCVVGTIMSNQGFESYIVAQGKKFIRTKVGDKHVVAQLEALNLPIGGEVSGHVVIRDYLATGDGIFVALKVLESVIQNSNWGMQTFEKFPQVMVNVAVAQKKDLSEAPFEGIIKAFEQELEKNGRIIVRYSGTEHVLRVMVEAAEQAKAHRIANQLASQLKAELEK